MFTVWALLGSNQGPPDDEMRGPKTFQIVLPKILDIVQDPCLILQRHIQIFGEFKISLHFRDKWYTDRIFWIDRKDMDTAYRTVLRDIDELIKLSIFKKEGKGRATKYVIDTGGYKL